MKTDKRNSPVSIRADINPAKGLKYNRRGNTPPIRCRNSEAKRSAGNYDLLEQGIIGPNLGLFPYPGQPGGDQFIAAGNKQLLTNLLAPGRISLFRT